MCLNCGCMQAHDDMGKPGVNLTYETVNRGEHPQEYAGAGAGAGSASAS